MLGTLVSQTLLNILALIVLGIVMFSTVGLFTATTRRCCVRGRAAGDPRRRARRAGAAARRAAVALARACGVGRARRAARRAQVRAGPAVFRQPRLGLVATARSSARGRIQWLSCYVLLVAFGLDDRAGIGAAAAVLFAVNVTAVLPATPSNLGVFQAACVAVLHRRYGVGVADALGYGIILQAVEIATAVVMGAPALLKEGVSWRDVRLRAMHASPVELSPCRATRTRARPRRRPRAPRRRARGSPCGLTRAGPAAGPATGTRKLCGDAPPRPSTASAI